MSDFSIENRRSGIWDTDARKIVNGLVADVWLEKVGRTEREDISHIEAVQWGIKLQDVIGREAGARLQLELKAADYELTHPTHTWMKSHFDFISADGSTLVEVKNYNAVKRNKYDADTGLLPADDAAQITHEAAVHGVQRCVLAVLFGGQELVLVDKTISDGEKEALIDLEATVWASVQTNTPPEAVTTDAASKLWPVSTLKTVVADQQLELWAKQLAFIKKEIKSLEDTQDALQAGLQDAMRQADTLVTFDGRVLATWKSAKPGKRFDTNALQQSMPDVFERFYVDAAGSRRFLLK